MFVTLLSIFVLTPMPIRAHSRSLPLTPAHSRSLPLTPTPIRAHSCSLPFIVHHISFNSLFNLSAMYPALPFFLPCSLLLLTYILSFHATLHYVSLSFLFCRSIQRRTSVCTCLLINTCISMHPNISIVTAASRCTFPLHSTLAHEALCILYYLSVPYSRSADLIISVPLYLLEHHSSLHHSSCLPSPILPLFPSASHPFPHAYLAATP